MCPSECVRWRTHFGYKKWQIFLLNIGLFWSHTRLFCNTQETRTRANLHQRSQAIVHSHAVYTTWQIPLSRMSVPLRIHIRVSFVLQKSPIFNQMCCKRALYLIESHPHIHWMFHSGYTSGKDVTHRALSPLVIYKFFQLTHMNASRTAHIKQSRTEQYV